MSYRGGNYNKGFNHPSAPTVDDYRNQQRYNSSNKNDYYQYYNGYDKQNYHTQRNNNNNNNYYAYSTHPQQYNYPSKNSTFYSNSIPTNKQTSLSPIVVTPDTKNQKNQKNPGQVQPIQSSNDERGEPILKSYDLGTIKQGNFVSSLLELVESDIGDIKSFKTTHIKDPDNTLKKKTKIEYIEGLSLKVPDPRIDNSITYSKSIAKSFSKPVNLLYLPIFKFDKYSMGDKPSNEILIWNLHSSTNSLIIKNNFSIYGSISEVKLIDDPLTAVPLGMCLLSFDGKVEEAHQAALKAVSLSNKKLVIQGRYIRCGLNENNKLYDEIYKKTMEVREERLRKQKRDEIEKEKQLKLEKIKQEQLAKEEQSRILQESRQKREAINQILPSGPKSLLQSNTSSEYSNRENLEKTKNLSVHDRHIMASSSFPLPFKFQKYISNRPYIYISDRYVSSMHVSADQLRKALGKYSISRILQQRNGFYLVFNHLKEAMSCFDNEDGKKFLNYTLYMTIYVPDDQLDDTRVGKSGNVKLAQKQIMKELNAYLLKDIREKVIGDMVLEILQTDEIIKLADESRIKKDKEFELMKQQEKEKLNMMNEVKDTVRIVKKLDLNIFKKKNIKKSFVPLSHSLNDAHSGNEEGEEEEDEEDEEDEEEDEEEEDDEEENNQDQYEDNNIQITEKVESLTKNKRKNQSSDESVSKRIKLNANVETHSDGDEYEKNDENEEDDEVGGLEAELSDITSPEIESKIEIQMDNVFQPSIESPGPVFDDHLQTFRPTLDFLKLSIKTKEDFEILSNLCKDMQFEKPIKDVKFWAWNHLESVKENDILREKKEEDVDDVDDFDYEDEILESQELKNVSGCFRTEGYHRIPDKLKREYLLHRRKLTNLNPVRHEDDDESNALIHNSVQSSRVNRANTRRFVADISAQKQIIGETDLLDLNQLNKRKKPVQFSRSAIHNWGLYALEPISAGEMIIEYVGERIRQQVAELREKKYLRSGIGSSYLFRIDENTVIDASKRGGIARFINHCCEPSCTAKIIKVGGKKRIVIYALRDVKKNEELTYDYKFERETNDEERIICLCGAPGCKGYLN